MSTGTTKKLVAGVLAAAVAVAGLALAETASAPPAAAVPPVVDDPGGLVTSDALPTVQIDGVVWDQHVVGETVYVVGQFQNARPAGSPPGSNQTPRANILAYDLTTGELIPGFAPVLNNQAYTVTSSPDGSHLYVGGQFTQVNGVNKWRIAALDPTTGALLPYGAAVDFIVNSLVATDTTVYAGGAFSMSSGNPRSRLAAFDATSGALRDWAPAADDRVQTLAVSEDGSTVFAGGMFMRVNGQPARGMAAIDPVTGALQPWPANEVVEVAGPNTGAMLDLRVRDGKLYGGGYTFGRSGGNLEGMFRADIATGVVDWVEDCHGDTYQVALQGDYVYKAAHVHQCHNMGGFPQSSNEITQWGEYMRHSLAYLDEPTGTMRRDQWNYDNWEGFPAPSLAHWYPEWQIGSHTGNSQATWAVEATDDYVLYGGEFLRVNNQAQQGLVRFATRDIAPNARGPRLAGAAFPVQATSPAAGYAQVNFAANYDDDHGELTYRIARNGAVVHTTTEVSSFWDRPTVSFLDSGLTPGQSYSYRVTAIDGDGNQALSDTVSVTVVADGHLSAYARQVIEDDPRIYWRLGDAPGSTVAKDSASGTQEGTVSAMTFGRPGPIIDDPSTAASPTGTSSRVVSPPLTNAQGLAERNPVVDELTVEAWFRSTGGQGGRLVGFGNNAGSNSGANTHDRLLYVSNDGRVHFGVRTRPEGSGVSSARERRVVSSSPGLNDGQWHHVVGTLSRQGMQLYVDGVRVASRADVNSGHGYYGYWRVGADTVTSGGGGWPGAPSSTRLNGDIAEVAIYHRALAPSDVARHYELSGRTPQVTPAPADAYGASVHARDPFLYYRFDETSGTVIADSGIRRNTGDLAGSASLSPAGVLGTGTAIGFTGSGSVSSRTALGGPASFSIEGWFSTTSTSGGQIAGFGSSRSGTSATSDRQVYLRDDGRLAFAVGGTSSAEIVTDDPVNDGEWHHVVATQGPAGMALYLDGRLAGTDAKVAGSGHVGYWRFGGDRTPAASTNDAFTGQLDEVVVYDRALTATEVLAHYVIVNPDGANQPPEAAFEVEVDGRTVTLDAAASTDPDGTIESYAWDLGDGTSATGEVVEHTYDSDGTFVVELTVTDDLGATGTTTRTVEVAAPVNEPPVGVIDVSVDGLSVVLDGSGSSDPDGEVVSWVWDLGDGSSAEGEVVEHAYLEGGTYEVTLTVTDDEGSSSTVTRPVTVAEPGAAVVFAEDDFERTVGVGWGQAVLGGAWTSVGNAALYSVGDGQGRHLLQAPGVTRQSYLTGVEAGDVLASVDLRFDQPPSGAGVYSSVVVRRIGTSDYRVRVRAMTSSTSLTLFRVVDGSQQTISATNVPGLVYGAGDVWRLQLQAEGEGPTELSARVWPVGQAEPDWQLTAVDSTPALQAAGGIGIVTYLSGSSNAPVDALYDNLLARSP